LRKISTLLPLLAAIATGWAAPAWAELRIQITKGASEAVPIAVVPFGWEARGAEPPVDVAAVIAADLASSGRFAPMERKDMIGRPTQPEQVRLEDWRLLKTDVVVIGRVLPAESGRYELQFHVFDVYRNQPLMAYSLKAPADNLRGGAHRVADMIFERLTGIPGVFTTRIAYVTVEKSGDNSTYRLVVADADGANAVEIAESAEPLMSPAWSPDGRRLAYVSFEKKASAIYVQELRTGQRRIISSHPGINGAPAWSPDGQQMAVALSREEGNLDIYVITLDSNEMRRITRNPAIDTEPTWAPDGSALYFTSDRSGGPQTYYVRLDSENARRVTFEGSYNARPRVSPDGRSLAVVHNDRGNYRVALVDIRRGTVQVLSDGRQDESPDFAPNGSMIIYATRDAGRGVLAAVSTDGRVQQRIAATEGEVREPVWSPYSR
jgi:TolB protein